MPKLNCRSGKAHTYDVVEGPMADDTIWDYVEDYVVFCTDQAIKALQYEGSYRI